jgi:hypothetical protein
MAGFHQAPGDPAIRQAETIVNPSQRPADTL